MPVKILAYGTLKRGYGNFITLINKHGNDHIVPGGIMMLNGFKMFRMLSGFPGVIETARPTDEICAQAIELSDKAFDEVLIESHRRNFRVSYVNIDDTSYVIFTISDKALIREEIIAGHFNNECITW